MNPLDRLLSRINLLDRCGGRKESGRYYRKCRVC